DSRALKTGFDIETGRHNFLLKSFLRRTQISKARQLFDRMPRKNTFSLNLLMSCYLKAGDLAHAQEIFDNMVEKTNVSWTILIGGYAKRQKHREAFYLYVQMFRTGMKPDHVTVATLLSGFDETSSTQKEVGQIHAHITRFGFGLDSAVSNSLLDSYFKCRSADSAVQLFDEMAETDLIAFNTMITGFAKEGLNEQALSLFSEMQHCGFRPSDFTLSALLRACGGSFDRGPWVHGLAIKLDFIGDVFVANALLDFYSKHDALEDMRKLFDEMPVLDGVSYNIVTMSYLLSGRRDEFLHLFRELQSSVFDGRNFPFAAMLSVASNEKDLEMGKQIHSQAIVTTAADEEGTQVGNALVDMYAKCGRFGEAETVFRKLCQKGSVAWTAMVSACVQQGLNDEALVQYKEMCRNDVFGDQATFATALKASANLAFLSVGKQLHCCIVRSGFVYAVFCGCALVDMYAKCGSHRDAVLVFESMPERNVISWNAMISAHAQNGDVDAAIISFREMTKSGVRPDHVTFLGVLTACSHSGRVEEAKEYFDSMVHVHGLPPSRKHYASLVDVLCRVGRFGEAEALMVDPDEIMWSSILNAARIHRNRDFAARAANALFEMDAIRDAASYVTMANVYAEAGEWQHMARVKKAMRDRGVRKVPAFSWVEVGRRVHVFSSNDTAHPMNGAIRRKLDDLGEEMERSGYVMDVSCALRNVDDDGTKAESLKHHSERMAIAFALIGTAEGMPILVVKNLRACSDCHEAVKVISRIVRREITVRDFSRFHHFKDGACSCNDFW
ncbi:hypothetical protein M569_00546, partial [Genlisea aurea]